MNKEKIARECNILMTDLMNRLCDGIDVNPNKETEGLFEFIIQNRTILKKITEYIRQVPELDLSPSERIAANMLKFATNDLHGRIILIWQKLVSFFLVNKNDHEQDGHLEFLATWVPILNESIDEYFKNMC